MGISLYGANFGESVKAVLYRWRGTVIAFFGVLAIWMGSAEPWVLWMLPVLFGVALRVWARCHIGEHSRGERLSVTVLSQGGPYALIRHPLYLSNVSIAIGCLLWWQGISWRSALLSVLVVTFYRALAHWEDLHLEQSMGDVWKQWRANVPGVWRPTWSRSPIPMPAHRSFLLAIRADSWTWIMLALAFGILWALRYFHVA